MSHTSQNTVQRPTPTMLAALFAAVSTGTSARWGDSSQWHMPEYCSTPTQMAQRGIEPLPANVAAQFKLLQVQTVIRHGARVPYMKMVRHLPARRRISLVAGGTSQTSASRSWWNASLGCRLATPTRTRSWKTTYGRLRLRTA